MTSLSSASQRRRITAHAQSRVVSEITCPEVKLTVAIIGRALLDAVNDNHDARAYVQSDDFAYWCDFVGIDTGRVRQRLQEKIAP